MTTILDELNPYFEIVSNKLKGKYIIASSVYKIYGIKILDNEIYAELEDIKNGPGMIYDESWINIVSLSIEEFDSDEAALLYFETKED